MEERKQYSLTSCSSSRTGYSQSVSFTCGVSPERTTELNKLLGGYHLPPQAYDRENVCLCRL